MCYFRNKIPFVRSSVQVPQSQPEQCKVSITVTNKLPHSTLRQTTSSYIPAGVTRTAIYPVARGSKTVHKLYHRTAKTHPSSIRPVHLRVCGTFICNEMGQNCMPKERWMSSTLTRVVSACFQQPYE
jgi:hypothetical protein